MSCLEVPCRVFFFADHILRFYIDYYNKVNSEQTATTFLQIYESTDEINRGSNNDQHHETSKEIKL